VSTAHETFKALCVLCIQGAMLAMVGFALRPMVRNPRYRIVVRGLRGRHFGKALLIVFQTLVIGGLLIFLVPGMDIGWLSLLGATGNVAVASPKDASTASTPSLVLPLAMVVLVIVVSPIAAFREERSFRRGTERQAPTHRFFRQLQFGLAHLIMGIPLGAALALGVTGSMFMREYRRAFNHRSSRLDAILESARTHLAYNIVLLTLVAVGASIVLIGHLSAAGSPA